MIEAPGATPFLPADDVGDMGAVAFPFFRFLCPTDRDRGPFRSRRSFGPNTADEIKSAHDFGSGERARLDDVRIVVREVFIRVA